MNRLRKQPWLLFQRKRFLTLVEAILMNLSVDLEVDRSISEHLVVTG